MIDVSNPERPLIRLPGTKLRELTVRLSDALRSSTDRVWQKCIRHMRGEQHQTELTPRQSSHSAWAHRRRQQRWRGRRASALSSWLSSPRSMTYTSDHAAIITQQSTIYRHLRTQTCKHLFTRTIHTHTCMHRKHNPLLIARHYSYTTVVP